MGLNQIGSDAAATNPINIQISNMNLKRYVSSIKDELLKKSIKALAWSIIPKSAMGSTSSVCRENRAILKYKSIRIYSSTPVPSFKSKLTF